MKGRLLFPYWLTYKKSQIREENFDAEGDPSRYRSSIRSRLVAVTNAPAMEMCNAGVRRRNYDTALASFPGDVALPATTAGCTTCASGCQTPSSRTIRDLPCIGDVNTARAVVTRRVGCHSTCQGYASRRPGRCYVCGPPIHPSPGILKHLRRGRSQPLGSGERMPSFSSTFPGQRWAALPVIASPYPVRRS